MRQKWLTIRLSVKPVLVALAILFLLASAAIIFYKRNSPNDYPASDVAMASKRDNQLSEYMNQHLPELTAATINGKQVRTLRIEYKDGIGTIEYTDGSFTHKADFTYAFQKDGGVVVNKFAIKN